MDVYNFNTEPETGVSEVGNSYRELFSYDPETIYLNNAATGMLPKKTTQAMIDFANSLAKNGEPQIEEIFRIQTEFRTEAGKLLNVDPESVTFLRNTSEGLEIALHSIDWQPGDNMIVQEDAFPASLYLAHYSFPKIEKRYIPMLGGGDFYEKLEKTIDESTRAVVIDYVHFLSGSRFDLNRLGKIVEKSNAYLIVDGIQALGAININLEKTPVDFFTAGGVKWLLSPSGSGLLYIRREILKDLIPVRINWAGAIYEDISSLYPIRELYDDCRRFQAVNENYSGMVALTASMRLFNEIGTDVIEKRIMALTANTMSMLEDLKCEILTPKENHQRAGIVTFNHPDFDSAKIFEALQARKVACSLREGYVRLAIHFYASESELKTVEGYIRDII